MTTGINALRSVEPIEPSERFRVRLRCRLALTRRRAPRAAFPWPARVAAAAIVGALIVGGVEQLKNEPGPTSAAQGQAGRRTAGGAVVGGASTATLVDFRLPAFGTASEPAPSFDSLGLVPLVNRGATAVYTVNASISR